MGITKSVIKKLEKKIRETAESELVVISANTAEETEALMEEARRQGKTPISIAWAALEKYDIKPWKPMEETPGWQEA